MEGRKERREERKGLREGEGNGGGGGRTRGEGGGRI